MLAACLKARRERYINRALIKPVGGEVFALERAWRSVRLVFVEPHVHTLKIHGTPDKAAGKDTINVPNHIEIVRHLTIDTGCRPQLAGAIGGLAIRQLREQ